MCYNFTDWIFIIKYKASPQYRMCHLLIYSGLSHQNWLSWAGWLPYCGFPSPTFQTPRTTVAQMKTDPHKHPRLLPIPTLSFADKHGNVQCVMKQRVVRNSTPVTATIFYKSNEHAWFSKVAINSLNFDAVLMVFKLKTENPQFTRRAVRWI